MRGQRGGSAAGQVFASPTFTGQAKFADGTAAAPSISFTNDPNTGIFSNTDGFGIGISIDGSQRWTFGAPAVGFVIGPTTILGWSASATVASASDSTLSRKAANTVAVNMGAGLGTAALPGIASVDTTAVGNVGAGTDDLITYTLPASSLSAATKGVRITAWGTTANNANAKTITLNFGSVAILTNALTASIAGVWRIEADVFSTGTDAQDAIAQLVTTGTAGVALNDVEFSTLTQDDGAAIIIKCTGTATSDNDIVQQGVLVEFFN